jgi:endonuclease/exonuclease/phosphatase (EEP) superfamily protein YafD
LLAGFNLIASALLIVPPVWSSIPQAAPVVDAGPRLKLMSANLWGNYGSVAQGVDLIRKESPDIVFLQEAYGPWRSALLNALPDYEIAAGCEYPHTCDAVVLTRLPVLEVLESGTARFVAARLQVERADGQLSDVLAVSLHLPRGRPEEGRTHLAAMSSLARQAGGRVIIAGDFNISAWDAELQAWSKGAGLVRQSGFSSTWPTPTKMARKTGIRLAIPGVALDQIFTDPAWSDRSEVRRLDFGSDHYAVLVELAY